MWIPRIILNRLGFLNSLQVKAKSTVEVVDRLIFEALLSLFVIFTVFWVSAFLYVVFYYSYVPAIEHRNPVYFQISDEKDGSSYPSAHVLLTKNHHLLMIGQPYKISLVLDMPESPMNRETGMFMVCLQLMSKGKDTVSQSCRLTMLKYTSPLVSFMKTVTLAPLYLLGSMEEKQSVDVELYSTFEEDPRLPITSAFIEIRSSKVEIYNAQLRVHAHFRGLRYFMHTWPLISAIFGMSFIFTIILFFVFLSWWRIYKPLELISSKKDEKVEDSVKAEVSAKSNTIKSDEKITLKGGKKELSKEDSSESTQSSDGEWKVVKDLPDIHPEEDC